METPVFKHHCKCCLFLGSYQDEQGIHYDLYFCPSPGKRRTGQVVSRWGEGLGGTRGFHLSTLRSEAGRKVLQFSAIREALRRAEAEGLTEQ